MQLWDELQQNCPITSAKDSHHGKTPAGAAVGCTATELTHHVLAGQPRRQISGGFSCGVHCNRTDRSPPPRTAQRARCRRVPLLGSL
mgnify:CR=1 FL=1